MATFYPPQQDQPQYHLLASPQHNPQDHPQYQYQDPQHVLQEKNSGAYVTLGANSASPSADRKGNAKFRRGYRPPILRTISLALVLALTLALIGLLEYTIQTLPTSSFLQQTTRPRKRQETYTYTYTYPSTTLVLTETMCSGCAGAPNPAFYLNTDSTTNSFFVTTTGSTTSASVTEAVPPSYYLGSQSTTNPIVMATTAPSATLMSSYYLGPQSAPTTTPTPGAPPPGDYSLNQGPFTDTDYFIGSYLPTLIAVIYKISWTIIYAAIKLLTPFFELAEPGGALAEKVFGLYYLSSTLRPNTLLALKNGHWLVFWTSIVVMVVGLMAPLASEVVKVDTQDGCTGGSGPNPCPPRLIVVWSVARILEGLLAFSAVILISLWSMQRKRSAGVWADPSSIATMTSLLHNPEVLGDFRNINPVASEKEVSKQLGAKRYALAYYTTPAGETKYGLVRVHGLHWHKNGPVYMPVQQHEAQPPGEPAKNHKTSRAMTIVDVGFGLLILGMFALVVAYYFASGNTGFNSWMSSQSFGPRFMMAIAGSVISSQWKRIEREVRTYTIYRRLATSPVPAHDSILLSTTTHPITTVPHALRHCAFFLAAISLVAFLSEALIITLASVPYAAGETYAAFHVSSYISVAVLTTMLAALVAVWVWRRGNPPLPRDPDTLASVWSYLCASRMRGAFDELGDLNKAELDRVVGGMAKSYFLGWKAGSDGVERWMVDEFGHVPGLARD